MKKIKFVCVVGVIQLELRIVTVENIKTDFKAHWI